MAMPRNYKGMHLQYKGKSFGLLLFLAFSSALFGVMAVHKLREKRVLNILLKQKEKELSAFQILLQKEKEQARDNERMTEEMKDVIENLSSQKKEFTSWILEMESTVSSLKEDRRAMAAVLEDRANEIKALHEKEMDMSKKESEEASLREIVRMREAEIEDLTRRLGLSMQESKARQGNVASPDEKRRSENAERKQGSTDEEYDQNRSGQDNSGNSSQDQQQSVIREEVRAAGDDHGNAEVVNAGESNGGIDRGNSEGEMKFEAADKADKVLAQPVRRGGMRLSRERLKRWRAIVRNRRMGKRGNRRIVERTREDQARGGNVGEQSATEKGTRNQEFGSTGFNDGDESSKIQSKVEIAFDKSADESHQNTQAGREATSNTGEVNRAGGEGDGEDDGEKQSQSDDARLNNSKDQSDNMDTLEMTVNDGNSLAGDKTARMENADSVESTSKDTPQMAVNDGSSLGGGETAQMNADSVESTDSSRETYPEDTKQYEANNNWNSFQATTEERDEEKIDEPEL